MPVTGHLMLDIPWIKRDPPIGDLLAAWLAKREITEEWATKKIFRRIGLKRCPCGQIRRWLNRRRWLHKIANSLGWRVAYDDGSIH